MPRLTEREALNLRIEFMYNHLFHQLKDKNRSTFTRIPHNGNTEYFHDARKALLDDFDDFDTNHRKENLHYLRTSASLEDVCDVHQLLESTLAYWEIMPAMTPVNLLMEGRLAPGHLVEDVSEDMIITRGTEENYWFMTDDGYLEFHGGGYLRNNKGYVYAEYQQSEIVGSEGVETGLMRIFNYALNGERKSGYEAEPYSRDRIIDTMLESGLNYYVNSGTINERKNWFWNLKENREQYGTRRIRLPREIREFYRREFEPHWQQVEGGFIGADYTDEAGDAKYHVGVDWVWVCNNRNCTIGQPVYSATDGVVTPNIGIRRDGRVDTRGKIVRIDCADGSRIDYFHLDDIVSTLEMGIPVTRGQLLGYAGNSGKVDPHLHIAKSYANSEKADILGYYEKRSVGKELEEDQFMYLFNKNDNNPVSERAYIIPPEPLS